MRITHHRIGTPAFGAAVLTCVLTLGAADAVGAPDADDEPIDFLKPDRFGKILPATGLHTPSPQKMLKMVVSRVRLDGEDALVEPTLKLAADSLADAFAENPQKGPVALLDALPELCRRREKRLAERDDEEFVAVTNHVKWPALMARLRRIVRKDPLLLMVDDWCAAAKPGDIEALVDLAKQRVCSHSGRQRRAAMRVLLPFLDRPEIARLVIREERWFVEHGRRVNRDVLRAMYHHRADLDPDVARPLLERVLRTPRQHANQPRMIAAIILGCLKQADALPVLLEQLNDPQVDSASKFVKEYHQPFTLRECLCFAVARLANASAFETLAANLAYRGTPHRPLQSEAAVRGAAAEGLARIGDRRAVLPLCNLLAVEQNASVAKVARDAVKALAGHAVRTEAATGVTVSVPKATQAHQPLPITVGVPDDMRRDALACVAFWRAVGEKAFEQVQAAFEDDALSATLPAEATVGPVAFYVELRPPDGPAVRFPQAEPGKVTAVVVPDTAAPTLPAAPQAVDVTSHTLTLQWPAAEDDTQVTGYRIYRGTDDEGLVTEANLAARLDASQHHWSDTPSAGTALLYAVVPVDRAGRAGKPGRVTVDVPPDSAPANDLSVRVCVRAAKELVLLWSGAMPPDVAAMDVQRAEGDAGEFETVATRTVDPEKPIDRWTDADVRRGVTYRYRLRLRDKAGQVGAFGDVVRGSLGDYARRINCGGHEVVDEGRILWEADRRAIRWSAAYPLDRPVRGVGSVPQAVYRIERWSSRDLEYTFENVPDGEYEVVLHFAESNDHVIRKGVRLFDVVINGETVASDVDVYRRAGGGLKAWRHTCRARANDGVITVRLDKVRMGPAIKGIEVRPAARP
ncbi:MAG: hypothetical protein KGY99_09950 [Phycisphaerae bacterium]|nr:hypothetical protein [Phycisphaerae bacterium]